MNHKLLAPYLFFLFVILITSTSSAGDIKGKVHVKGVKKSAGVLVYIEYVDSSFTPPKKHALIDQKDLMFMPVVLPILAGTTVDFLNSDSVLHNVFTPSKCAGNFNLGTWPRGEIRSHTFENAGCFVTILCEVHPDMQAWIAVLQNPYFVRTNQKGEYEIKNIPPGNYELRVWYPFYKTKSEHITVKKFGAIRKDFNLKR